MRRVDDDFVWKLSQIAIKVTTPDVLVINDYVGKFWEKPSDQCNHHLICICLK